MGGADSDHVSRILEQEISKRSIDIKRADAWKGLNSYLSRKFSICVFSVTLSLSLPFLELKYTGFVLFDLILYVPSTIFHLNRDGSSWVEPVLS